VQHLSPVFASRTRSHLGHGGIATRHPFGLLGIPLMPYDMLRMTPFSLFRRTTEEL
jgi:hypothetical protein